MPETLGLVYFKFQHFHGRFGGTITETEEEWKSVIINWIESDGTVDLGDSIEIRKIEEEIGKAFTPRK